MSTVNIIVLLVAAVALVAFLAARSGPRVTQITRTVHKGKEDEE